MPKLRLKRTPAEEAERERKKRSKRKSSGERKHKKRRTESESMPDFEDDLHGHPRPSSSKHPYDVDGDDIDSRLEEERFAEKLRDAMEDDATHNSFSRLDGVSARMNDYSHVPKRWRGTDDGFSAGLWMEDAAEEMGVETWQMNDDEYSEYIRAGMWRKQHEEEFKERRRRRIGREEAEEYARSRRKEKERMAREATIEINKLKQDRLRRFTKRIKADYEEDWKRIQNPDDASSTDIKLKFVDIPWPLTHPYDEDRYTFLQGLTGDNVKTDDVRSFLLDTDSPSRAREILRLNLLRYHPDKFDRRILQHVTVSEVDRVRDVALALVRILNDLVKNVAEKGGTSSGS